MDHVHEVLDTHRDKLLRAWAAAVSEGTESEVGAAKAKERAVTFLEGLKTALSSAASGGEPSPPSRPEPLPETAESTDPVLDVTRATRAFGALQCLILELAAKDEVVVSPAEQLTLALHTNVAIEGAAELQRRQHDRDLWKTAHQLRNPLGSAMMALTLLRSRIDMGANVRLAETLERNLKRLEGLIDEAVSGHRGTSLSTGTSSP